MGESGEGVESEREGDRGGSGEGVESEREGDRGESEEEVESEREGDRGETGEGVESEKEGESGEEDVYSPSNEESLHTSHSTISVNQVWLWSWSFHLYNVWCGYRTPCLRAMASWRRGRGKRRCSQ